MDSVARLPSADRNDLFGASARKRKLSPLVVEKDFWVCWTLHRIFTLPAPPAHVLFKGGTSLSKVFKAIDRFSEDIDLSFNREDLGFGGDNDPTAASSGKQRERGLSGLKTKCQAVIREEMLPALLGAFTEALQVAPGTSWKLVLDPDDPDQQTLLFQYPTDIKDAAGYINPLVRLEFGARSDHWPTVRKTIISYAAEDFPDAFPHPECEVQALSAERTFWEKATALHAWCHMPEQKAIAPRNSRHYYDLVQLVNHDAGKNALQDVELLTEVVRHKKTFYASAWASYDTAIPGSFRLVPSEPRIGQLRQDYERMREMFFVDPPPFDNIIAALRDIESLINSRQ